MKRRSVKTDNSNLPLKLELRRRLLTPFAREYRLRVMDCCAGHRKIWNRLRSEFPVERYTGFDKKGLPGSLRVDSARWLRHVGIAGNVVDVDTYGEPWAHWRAILAKPWPQDDVLVFLTVGAGMGGLGKLSKSTLSLGGIPESWFDRIPPSSQELRRWLESSALASCLRYGVTAHTVLRARAPESWTVYYGLRLQKGCVTP